MQKRFQNPNIVAVRASKLLARKLARLFGDKVHAVYLYGSASHRMARHESDIDVIVVHSKNDAPSMGELQRAQGMVDAFNKRLRLVIKPILCDEKTFKRYQRDPLDTWQLIYATKAFAEKNQQPRRITSPAEHRQLVMRLYAERNDPHITNRIHHRREYAKEISKLAVRKKLRRIIK